MNARNAIDALAIQNQRLTDLLRNIDGGIWWGSNPAAKIDADAISVQADQIRIALDEVSRLARGLIL